MRLEIAQVEQSKEILRDLNPSESSERHLSVAKAASWCPASYRKTRS